mmetsp:Transcript_983/g.2142  ORF Transcript_983/g.2142 Transcript_983/m.2142 type:complete len:409 (+) Transcript_983:1049-2275(+)
MRMRVVVAAAVRCFLFLLLLDDGGRQLDVPDDLPRGRDLAEFHLLEDRVLVDGPGQRRRDLYLLRPRQVDLVQHHDVGGLDLLRQELRDLPGGRAIVVRRRPAVPLSGGVPRHEVRPEGAGVDQSHDPLHVGPFRDGLALRPGHLPVLLDGDGITHPAQLHHQCVESLLASSRLGVQEVLDGRQELVRQGAAGATVLKLDDAVPEGGGGGDAVAVRNIGLLHELRVDVDAGHVVDDHADPEAVLVFQKVLEGRRLSGSEKSGQERDRDDVLRLGGIEGGDSRCGGRGEQAVLSLSWLVEVGGEGSTPPRRSRCPRQRRRRRRRRRRRATKPRPRWSRRRRRTTRRGRRGRSKRRTRRRRARRRRRKRRTTTTPTKHRRKTNARRRRPTTGRKRPSMRRRTRRQQQPPK